MIDIQSFSDECTKIASSTMKALLKAELFHDDPAKDWNQFEKDLKSKPFQKAMLLHDGTKADSKLVKYVKSYGGYLTSKDRIAGVPSRTSGKTYPLKKLPGGRLGCGCKDWQYVHSVKGSDCDHIKAFKASGLYKKSSAQYAVFKGMGAMHLLEKQKKKLKRPGFH
jgi:hypothetical protein